MPGPWEKFAEPAGPWARFREPETFGQEVGQDALQIIDPTIPESLALTPATRDAPAVAAPKWMQASWIPLGTDPLLVGDTTNVWGQPAPYPRDLIEQPEPERPGFLSVLGSAIERGAASSLAGTLHAISDFVGETVASPQSIFAEAGVIDPDSEVRDAIMDPLGARALAAESLGAEREIAADRAAATQAIGGRPTLGQALDDPLGAAGQYGLHLANIGGESVPLMAAAVATRNPGLGASLLGGVTGAQEFTDLRTQGVDRADAAEAAALSGLIESAGEAFGLPRVLGSGAGLGGFARAALAEGVQEAPVSVGQQIVQDLATGNETPVMQQIGDAIDAALVGGALGAGGHGVSRATDRMLRPPEDGGAAPRSDDRPPSNAIDTSPIRPEPTPEDTSDLDAMVDNLLLRNLPEGAGTPPAPAAATPTPPMERASQPQAQPSFNDQVRSARSQQTTAPAVQPSAGQPAPAPAGGDLSMQNRDRARTASVAQMRDIARDPDPTRLGFSRDPNTGVPMVGEGRQVPEQDKGRTDTVVMASGRRVPVRYAVVEASELAASHDAAGMVNPDYETAPLKALNNGRTAGLQAAYAAGTTDSYRQGIAADAALHGVSPEAIAGKRQPVLVRLYDPAMNTGDMGAESNASQQLGLSPTEQAQTDARALPDLAGITWAEDGTIPPAANANFFRAWFANMGDTQAASLQDAQGRPNAAALNRVRAALVSRAYRDDRLLTAMAEDVNPDRRNVLNALTQAAPAFASLDQAPLVDDLRQAMVGGLEVLRDADARGLSLEDALGQGDLLGRNPEADAIARFMAGNARSPKRMAEAFRAMAEYAASAEAQAATLDVFGTAPTPTVGGALERAGVTDDTRATAGGLAQGRGGREPGQDERAALGIAEEQPGFLPEPTAREEVEAERRRRDAARDGRTGTGRTDMLAGEGDLFAGPRPEQLETGTLPAQDGATYGPTRPLFGSRDGVASPAAAAGRSAGVGVQGQLDLFVATRGGKPPGQGHEPAVRIDRARLQQAARLVETGQFRSGVERVETLADAAHILAPLRKSAQERFMVLALDAEQRPLAVMQHTIGTIDGSEVHTGMVLGAIASIPGVESVVFAHNHPSGNPRPSPADLAVDQRLLDLFRGSGIEVRGSIIVQPGQRTFTTYGERGIAFREGPVDNIRPGRRSGSVPQVERQLRRVQPIGGREELTSPSRAEQAVRARRAESPAGVLLLNNRHEVTGFLPFDPKQSERLRTGNLETSHARFIAQATEANAAAAILYGDRADETGIANMARAMKAGDLRVLDTFLFDGDAAESQASRGRGMGEGVLLSEEADPFFSAALRAIEEGKGAPKRGTAEQWKGWLDGAVRRGDMKQSERDWLGIDDWLAQQDGRISREDLAEFVRANEVQVQDVVLDENSGQPKVSDALNLWMGDNIEDAPESADDWRGVAEMLDEYGDEEHRRLSREASEIASRVEGGAVIDERPKFASYQLPGGENYRELLLTLPVADDRGTSFTLRNPATGGTVGTFGTEAEAGAFKDSRADLRQHEIVGAPSESRPTHFRSSHFDQPNILAHVRFNERTDADGKRVLFLEEIQSDWHQAGRKRGYGARPMSDAEVRAAAGVSESWWNNLHNDDRQQLRREVERDVRRDGVPDAPFKGTDEWAMLAFKRMVRWAAEHGFDRIAWTTGEQQAERYDLAKTVSQVSYSDGNRLIVRDKGGAVIYNDTTPENRVADVIGKEAAERLLAQPPRDWSSQAGSIGARARVISGDGLKMGGEGMRAFYDKILPAAVNKWGKRFDAKVGRTEVATEGYNLDAEENRVEAHSLDLTPAMREAALEGQPLFQVGEAADDTANTLTNQFADEQAESRGLKQAVRDLLGDVPVEWIAGTDTLPANLRSRLRTSTDKRGRALRTKGLFDPKTSKVYLVTSNLRDGHDAAWTAAHEIAGHKGLRTLFKDKVGLRKALSIAQQNPTVAKLSDAIYAYRNYAGRTDKPETDLRFTAIEEALAELAAAIRTGDYDTIRTRYGVNVAPGIRASVKRAIENFIRRIKALFDRQGAGFSDAEVRELLEAAWQAGREPAQAADAEPFESAEDQTQTPAFRRWFGDSKVVDDSGKPLVVYHGSPARDFTEFDVNKINQRDPDGPYNGFFFSADRDEADRSGRFPWRRPNAPEAQTRAFYLSIKNPASPDYAVSVALELRKSWDTKYPAARSLNDAVRIELQNRGFDGILHDAKLGTWVAFRPEQIKSATGNRGTFDPDSPSILESVDYTPEQEAFMRKAGVGRDTRGTAKKLRDWMGGKRPDVQSDELIQSTLDGFYGLKKAVAKAGNIPVERDPYVAARMVNIASTMEAILRFGAPRMERGVLRVDRSIPGLYDALVPVHDRLPEFFGWMVARRAQALKKQGRENLMSEADIAAGLSLAKGHEADFNQVAGDYLRLKNAILDFAEQHGGTIDPVARAAWDHAEYLPFYREGDLSGPGTRKGIANQSSGIRTLKGGEQALRDPLSNIVQNFTRLMDSALKNRAMQLAVDELGPAYFKKRPLEVAPSTIPLDQVKRHLKEQGVDQATIDAMPTATLKGTARMLSIQAPVGDNVVRVMRNGKPEYYEVLDPLVLRSVSAMHEFRFSDGTEKWVMNPLAWTKNLLTAGATMTPDFLIRNSLRDTGEATVTSREGFIPIWDTARGGVESLRESELAQDLMMAGSYFHGGLFHQSDYEATARATRRALRKHGLTDSQAERVVKSLLNPKRWWDVYRAGLEASEMGSRISLARNRLDKTGNFLEAAFEAKDFLDFQLKGDAALLQFFVRTIPFLNARLQGNYRLARAATAKDRRKVVLARMASLALATTALYAWNMLAYRDEYEELPEWERDAYWHFAPGTSRHVRIPKPFELGLVAGTGVERGLGALTFQWADGKAGDRPEQTWKALLRGILDTLAINPIPQGLKPAIETFFDYDTFTGRPIESRGDEFKVPSERVTPRTSETAIAASRGMEALLSEDDALSPKQLEHLWRGYTGGMGMYLLNGADWVTRKLENAPEPPDKALRDFPGIGAIYRGDGVPYSTRWVDEFYDLRAQAKMQSDRIKSAVEDGNEGRARNLEREWGWLLGQRQDSKRAKGGFMHAGVRELEAAAKELSALRKDDASIYADREMSGAEKRKRLEANARKRNAIARKIAQRLREAERTR